MVAWYKQGFELRLAEFDSAVGELWWASLLLSPVSVSRE
jgi:hypothetical protein